MAKVLIIEDDKLLSKVYKLNFDVKGYEVDLAQDGQEAWEKIKSNNHDAILLDLRLPKISGQKLLTMIRKNLSSRNKPVLILSNIDEKDTVKNVMSLGATAYLYKDKMSPQGVVSEVGKYLN